MTEGSRIHPTDLPEDLHTIFTSEEEKLLTESDVVDKLYQTVVNDGESFWFVVYKPFMERKISRVDMIRFLERIYREGGNSYKGMARILGIENQYRKLFNALYHHDLRIKDKD
jgi:hypothetical protein